MANKAKTKDNKVTIQSKEVAKEEKVKIYEFDPVIYPFRLWVAVRPSFEQVDAEFETIDTEDNIAPFTKDFLIQHISCTASCYPAWNKESMRVGALLCIWRKQELTTCVIAHEASHITDYLCDRTGVKGFDMDSGEARAYFLGWVAGCIEKVKQGKV